MKTTITPPLWPALAAKLQVEEAVLRAVAEVESKGEGFITGIAGGPLPKVLFEAHQFHRLTNGRYDASHPNLSAPWNPNTFRSLYAPTPLKEWGRLQDAMALDKPAAQASASWGAFQILGSNYGACGFSSVQEFCDAMFAGADEQLQAFGELCARYHQPQLGALINHMRLKNWAMIARLYNGPEFLKNKYDTKLAAAYQKYATPMLAGS